MPSLFPVFDAPELVEENRQSSAPAYRRSWLFDLESGDFVIDGSGRVAEADGLNAWAQWCIKAVMTERFAFLSYGPNYGGELREAKRQPTKKAAEAEIARTITETLLVDPRTETVRDFAYVWRGDEVMVSFTIVPVVGDSRRLEVRLNG
ncbi:DUF2634 domain-containing protein [Cohnella massiliensis]|uniref:DUF2634 domain-containing protein n=1 Tax=Cohnella massiliensis TaxID=1816691 RepID=UPI0009BAD5A4|nr:DUF2634 domain-containing protein [Cohnella massiliensis]